VRTPADGEVQSVIPSMRPVDPEAWTGPTRRSRRQVLTDVGAGGLGVATAVVSHLWFPQVSVWWFVLAAVAGYGVWLGSRRWRHVRA